MAGPTTRRRRTLNSRCNHASGTFVNDCRSTVPDMLAATSPAVRLSNSSPITGAAARDTRAIATPDRRVAQKIVSAVSSRSCSRWTSEERRPPSTKSPTNDVNTPPAMKSPTSEGLSRRARAMVCPRETT